MQYPTVNWPQQTWLHDGGIFDKKFGQLTVTQCNEDVYRRRWRCIHTTVAWYKKKILYKNIIYFFFVPSDCDSQLWLLMQCQWQCSQMKMYIDVDVDVIVMICLHF